MKGELLLYMVSYAVDISERRSNTLQGKVAHVILCLLLDVDECKTGANSSQQKCINTLGSYVYRCLPGYRLNGIERACDGIVKLCDNLYYNFNLQSISVLFEIDLLNEINK